MAFFRCNVARGESRRKPLWKWVGGCLALALFLSMVGRPLFQMLVPVHIDIGPETTVIDGPLTPDGRVDYVAAMNQRLRDGVTPDNNAAVPLVRAFGPATIDAPLRPEFFERLGVDVPPAEGGAEILPPIPSGCWKPSRERGIVGRGDPGRLVA